MAYELWCWVVEEEDGSEGVIAAFVPTFAGPMVLQSRSRQYAETLEPLAAAHCASSGRPVRLVHLMEVDF